MKIKINVDIYSARVYIVTTSEELLSMSPSDYELRGEFFTVEAGSNDFYVLVSDLWGSYHDYRFIQCMSHELNHVAMSILNRSGVNFDYENQEALCYLQDFMMSKFFKKVQSMT